MEIPYNPSIEIPVTNNTNSSLEEIISHNNDPLTSEEKLFEPFQQNNQSANNHKKFEFLQVADILDKGEDAVSFLATTFKVLSVLAHPLETLEHIGSGLYKLDFFLLPVKVYTAGHEFFNLMVNSEKRKDVLIEKIALFASSFFGLGAAVFENLTALSAFNISSNFLLATSALGMVALLINIPASLLKILADSLQLKSLMDKTEGLKRTKEKRKMWQELNSIKDNEGKNGVKFKLFNIYSAELQSLEKQKKIHNNEIEKLILEKKDIKQKQETLPSSESSNSLIKSKLNQALKDRYAKKDFEINRDIKILEQKVSNLEKKQNRINDKKEQIFDKTPSELVRSKIEKIREKEYMHYQKYDNKISRVESWIILNDMQKLIDKLSSKKQNKKVVIDLYNKIKLANADFKPFTKDLTDKIENYNSLNNLINLIKNKKSDSEIQSEISKSNFTYEKFKAPPYNLKEIKSELEKLLKEMEFNGSIQLDKIVENKQSVISQLRDHYVAKAATVDAFRFEDIQKKINILKFNDSNPIYTKELKSLQKKKVAAEKMSTFKAKKMESQAIGLTIDELKKENNEEKISKLKTEIFEHRAKIGELKLRNHRIKQIQKGVSIGSSSVIAALAVPSIVLLGISSYGTALPFALVYGLPGAMGVISLTSSIINQFIIKEKELPSYAQEVFAPRKLVERKENIVIASIQTPKVNLG